MSNDLTTQRVTEGAVTGRSLSLGGTQNPRFPVFKDNVIKQFEDRHGELLKSSTVRERHKDKEGSAIGLQ